MALAFTENNRKRIFKNISIVFSASIFITLSAQVIVPFVPVPVTFQTLAILIIGLIFGSRLGFLSVATYLIEGAIGFPVFAGGMSSIALIGPTAGFLYGFLIMVCIAGLVKDLKITNIVSVSLVTLTASLVLYIPGILWPMFLAETIGLEAAWVGLPFNLMWSGWIAPFVLIDILKSLIAAFVFVGFAKSIVVK